MESKCDFEGCGKTFVQPDALAKHKNIHTDLYTCKFCQRRCSTLGWLKKHEMTHSSLKPFKCDQCVAEFVFQEALDKHFKKVHEGVRFKCDKCEKDYSDKTGLRHHMIMEHGAMTKSVCEICGQRFGGNTMLEKHMETTHSTGERKYVCDECGKSFLARRHYWLHKRIHGEKTFKCSFCPSAFTKRKYLTDHENIHTCAKTFPCPFCGIVYRQLSSMVAHKRKCGKATN